METRGWVVTGTEGGRDVVWGRGTRRGHPQAGAPRAWDRGGAEGGGRRRLAELRQTEVILGWGRRQGRVGVGVGQLGHRGWGPPAFTLVSPGLLPPPALCLQAAGHGRGGRRSLGRLSCDPGRWGQVTLGLHGAAGPGWARDGVCGLAQGALWATPRTQSVVTPAAPMWAGDILGLGQGQDVSPHPHVELSRIPPGVWGLEHREEAWAGC